MVTRVNKECNLEKIISKMEERTKFLHGCKKNSAKLQENGKNPYDLMMMYEVAGLVEDLIDIVKDEAEKHKSV